MSDSFRSSFCGACRVAKDDKDADTAERAQRHLYSIAVRAIVCADRRTGVLFMHYIKKKSRISVPLLWVKPTAGV
jgi:hypothetical protein